MPTHRTKRRVEPDAVTAIRAGLPLAYTPENWDVLLGLRFFNDEPGLLAAKRERIVGLMEAWREQHLAERGAHEQSRVERPPHPRRSPR